MKKKLLPLLITLLSVLPIFDILAVTIPNPLRSNTLAGLIDSLATFVLYLAVAIAPIIIIFAGFKFVMAAGEPAKIEEAKKMIWWVIIGLIIVFSARVIIAFFRRIFPTS